MIQQKALATKRNLVCDKQSRLDGLRWILKFSFVVHADK